MIEYASRIEHSVSFSIKALACFKCGNRCNEVIIFEVKNDNIETINIENIAEITFLNVFCEYHINIVSSGNLVSPNKFSA